jgi:catalase
VDGASISQVQEALAAQGAVPRLVGPHVGAIVTADGDSLDADASLENEPGFLFDALVLPDGEKAVAALAADGHTMEFIKDQYRHCKTILALGASASLLKAAGIDGKTPQGKPDAGVIAAQAGGAAAGLQAFIKGVSMPRDFSRETDPPRV